MVRLKTIDIALTRRPQPNELAGAQGKDFSGLDLVQLTLDGQNFFESIFNGCLFEGIRATQSVFQHTEFTEARFSHCTFEDSSFDHSDFVLSEVRDSEFVRCSFQNAEWRDTIFDGVTFRQCIFRNTTTSLAQFSNCSFDTASAASFIGASKRFSLYSQTQFLLPVQHIDFLRLNFGLLSQEQVECDSKRDDSDPFFALSVCRFFGELDSLNFYRLLLAALSRIMSDSTTPNRLRMGYLKGICKVMLDENLLSIFAIQLLERELSRIVASFENRDQVLELMGLILTLRVTLGQKVESIEKEILEFQEYVAAPLDVRLEFENTYTKPVIEKYLTQLGVFCGVSQEYLTIKSVRKGSTFVEFTIAAATFLPDVLRFFKYSLCFATATVSQAGKLRDAYHSLKAPRTTPSKAVKPRGKKSLQKRPDGGTQTRHKGTVSHGDRQNLTNTTSEYARPIEVFVDRERERVLIVDGRLKVSITLL